MSKQWHVGHTLVQAPQPLQRMASVASSGSSKCVAIQSRTLSASISRFAETRTRAAARSSVAWRSRAAVAGVATGEKRAGCVSSKARPFPVVASKR